MYSKNLSLIQIWQRETILLKPAKTDLDWAPA